VHKKQSGFLWEELVETVTCRPSHKEEYNIKADVGKEAVIL
jgi:hypothetical protein